MDAQIISMDVWRWFHEHKTHSSLRAYIRLKLKKEQGKILVCRTEHKILIMCSKLSVESVHFFFFLANKPQKDTDRRRTGWHFQVRSKVSLLSGGVCHFSKIITLFNQVIYHNDKVRPKNLSSFTLSNISMKFKLVKRLVMLELVKDVRTSSIAVFKAIIFNILFVLNLILLMFVAGLSAAAIQWSCAL